MFSAKVREEPSYKPCVQQIIPEIRENLAGPLGRCDHLLICVNERGKYLVIRLSHLSGAFNIKMGLIRFLFSFYYTVTV